MNDPQWGLSLQELYTANTFVGFITFFYHRTALFLHIYLKGLIEILLGRVSELVRTVTLLEQL